MPFWKGGILENQSFNPILAKLILSDFLLLLKKLEESHRVSKEFTSHFIPDDLLTQQKNELENIYSEILANYHGEIPACVIREMFESLCLGICAVQKQKPTMIYKYSRQTQAKDTIIPIRQVLVGEKEPVIIAGPCSVENEIQLRTIAQKLKQHHIQILRAGSYKPRTSPYSFQGLGIQGLKLIAQVAADYDMVTVSEIVDIRDIEIASKYIDIIQIGSRSMTNFSLLKEVGHTKMPVLLKRGMSATIHEFLLAAEYILSEGNPDVILCERGIRTFEKWTRNTLDVSGIAIIRQESHLPIIADISHSAGRTDILAPIAKASLAAGAQGIMMEVHHSPEEALSDPDQQMNFVEFEKFMREILLFKENIIT